jgi:hypothetical protein
VQRDALEAAVQTYCAALQEGDAQVISSMKVNIDALAAGDTDESFGRKMYRQTLQSEELKRRLEKINS